MHWFTTAGNGGIRDAGNRPGDDAMCGNAVMYDAGKIITFGGSVGYQDRPGTTRSVLITLTGTTVTTKTVGPLTNPRVHSTGVVLPDGKVLALGGQAEGRLFQDVGAAFEVGAP
jgi:galactose oxidase